VSEISDAIVVIVSEETGVISVVTGGKIKRNYNASSLKTLLKKQLADSETESSESGKNPFLKVFSKRKEDDE
jgi:diadenylate cyclase